MRTLPRLSCWVVCATCAATALMGAQAPAGAQTPAPGLPVPAGVARVADTTCVRDTAADTRFVGLAYRAVLRRDADPAGSAFWVGQLAYPWSMTYDGLALHLADTDEYRSLVVGDLYAQILHRGPDAGGMAFWVAWLRGRTATDLAVTLFSSAEYWSDAGSNASGWVTQLYRDTLGREPDPSGLSYWVSVVTSGGNSLAEVAGAFWQSREHRLARVLRLYHLALGRDPDPAGQGYWADQLLVHDDTWVLAQLVASPEFWTLAQVTFGGAPTPQPPPCPPPPPPPPAWPAAGQKVSDLRGYPSTAPRLIALTFDDGPDPTWTPQVLDVLASRGVTATFMPIGTSVVRYPDLVRRELAAGHHVGNQTWDHPYLTSLDLAGQASEISRATDAVNAIAGANVVHCLRPPYGSYDSTTISVAASQGLGVVLWSRDPRDWSMPGVAAIVSGSLDTTYDGGRGILLLHDGGGNRSQTVAALGTIIDDLRAQGYQFVTIC